MSNIEVSDFYTTDKGIEIKKYTLVNKNGMTAEIINFGGILTALTAPDRNLKYEDVVLGFIKPENYIYDNEYFYGAIIGRFANRIAGGKFSINGEVFNVTKNENENQIHGGENGFFNRIWNAEILSDSGTLKLTYLSKDGEEGFPGNLNISVNYTLTDDNELEIFCEATTDKPTVINITTHSYFNLSGDFKEKITDHYLSLDAKKIIPIDNSAIPLNYFLEIENTPFDFQKSKLIGQDINIENEQLKVAKGYDHCYVLDGEGLRNIGNLYHPISGRKMEVFTDQPGVQLYSGNHLNGNFETKTGGKNTSGTGICLETQHFPDSPNRSDYPSTILRPGEKYQTKTIYKFSVL